MKALSLAAIVCLLCMSSCKERSISHISTICKETDDLQRLLDTSGVIGSIIDQISMTAEERYDHFYESRGSRLSRVPLQYIAS